MVNNKKKINASDEIPEISMIHQILLIYIKSLYTWAVSEWWTNGEGMVNVRWVKAERNLVSDKWTVGERRLQTDRNAISVNNQDTLWLKFIFLMYM